jgi:lauroyl/myristoyl acyltransferase
LSDPVSRPLTRPNPLVKRIRRETTLLAWHGWQRLDAILPRKARFAIATGLGELLFWLLPRMRAATLANMRQVLGPSAPEARVQLMARRSFRNYAKYLSEFTHLPRWTDEDLERLVTSTTGWQNIEIALAEKKGVIFVTPHFGNWDIAGWYYGLRHPFWAVAEPLEPPELDVLIQGWRRAKHMGVIPLANAARGVLRALHNGESVALVADRPTHAQGDGAPVVFFGERTRVPAGAAHFALRTGAPVVVVGVWRTPSNTYEALALPPLHFSSTGDPKQDVANAMQRIIDNVEGIIREHPDQWYMFRRMWPNKQSAVAVGRDSPAAASGDFQERDALIARAALPAPVAPFPGEAGT